MKNLILFIGLIITVLPHNLSAKNRLELNNKQGETELIAEGKSVRITDISNKNHRGKFSCFTKDSVIYLTAGKDTILLNDVSKIRVYFQPTRIGGSIVTGAGAAFGAFGIATMIAASTEIGEPGSWADLVVVLGALYTVGAGAVTGAGLLVRSIGVSYDMTEWKAVVSQMPDK
jgi:hypothetical protein